jgi:hypothetical protein
MSRYISFTKLKHLIFLNGGSTSLHHKIYFCNICTGVVDMRTVFYRLGQTQTSLSLEQRKYFIICMDHYLHLTEWLIQWFKQMLLLERKSDWQLSEFCYKVCLVGLWGNSLWLWALCCRNIGSSWANLLLDWANWGIWLYIVTRWYNSKAKST